jgi:hypothetical protein
MSPTRDSQKKSSAQQKDDRPEENPAPIAALGCPFLLRFF